MKRIISLLIALVLISSTAFAADYTDKLDVLSAMGAASSAREPGTLVTRQEFAQAAAIMSGSGVLKATDTPYVDVKADNEYSGYVKQLLNLGIISTPGVSLSINGDAKIEAEDYAFLNRTEAYDRETGKAIKFNGGSDSYIGWNLEIGADGSYSVSGIGTGMIASGHSEIIGELYVDDNLVASAKLNTNEKYNPWENPLSTSFGNIDLAAGNHTLKMVVIGGTYILDYINLTAGFAGTTADGSDNAAELNFDPEGYCTREFVFTTALGVLGYGEYIDMMGGYEKAASKLKLSQETTFSGGYLTYEGLVDLMFQMFETPLPNVTYTTEGNNYLENMSTSGSKSYISERLNVSAYNGIMTDMDYNSYRVIMDIEENVYTNNKTELAVGSEQYFDVALSVDINKYEMVPVTFWVNADKKIIAMYPQEGYYVRYSPIYSVNGDSNETHKYAIGNMTTLTLLDDEEEYDVNENAKAKHNLALTTKAQKYAGSYAKLVFNEDDEVTFIETWDLAEGGILAELGEVFVTYKKGNSLQKINPITQYERKVVIINDESRDYQDLKPDTYFDIYKVKGDTLVIVAQEKIITSTFNGVGEDYIDVGGTSYQVADELYFTADGEKYTTSQSDLLSASGYEVNVYFNALREAKYVKVSVGQEVKLNEFVGILDGYKKETFSEKAQMAVISLDGGLSRNVYTVSDKIKYKAPLSSIEVLSTPKDTTGKGIYLFKVNGKGEVTEISQAPAVYGFENQSGKTQGSLEMTEKRVALSVANSIAKNVYYDAKMPFYVLHYDADNEFSVGMITGTDLAKYNKHSGTAIEARLIGYGDTPGIRFGLILGTKDFYNYSYSLAVAKKGGRVADEDGKEYDQLTIYGREKTTTVKITDKLSAMLPDVSYIHYSPTVSPTSDNTIYLKRDETKGEDGSKSIYMDLTGDFSTWKDKNIDREANPLEPEKHRFRKGVVQEVFSDFIIFEGGEGYYFNPKQFILYEVGKAGKDGNHTFGQMEVDNLSTGEEVYYYVASDSSTITALFSLK